MSPFYHIWHITFSPECATFPTCSVFLLYNFTCRKVCVDYEMISRKQGGTWCIMIREGRLIFQCEFNQWHHSLNPYMKPIAYFAFVQRLQCSSSTGKHVQHVRGKHALNPYISENSIQKCIMSEETFAKSIYGGNGIKWDLLGIMSFVYFQKNKPGSSWENKGSWEPSDAKLPTWHHSKCVFGDLLPATSLRLHVISVWVYQQSSWPSAKWYFWPTLISI